MSKLQIKLKNRNKQFATLDEKGYAAVQKDKYLSALNFTENLRAHSNGYPIFQRCVTTEEGVQYETIYLHRWLAEKFLKKPKNSAQRLFLKFKDANPQNCRLDNLEYATMSQIRIASAGRKSKAKVVKSAKAAASATSRKPVKPKFGSKKK